MAQLDFSVDSEFLARLPSMLPELTSLSAERLWQETLKAFSGQPARYFDAANGWGLLQALLANVETVTVKGTESTSNSPTGYSKRPPNPWPGWRHGALRNAGFNWPKIARSGSRPKSAFALLDQMGALKHTPRSELFLDTLAGAGIDATRIRDALEQSLKIKAQDLAAQYQGKALGGTQSAPRKSLSAVNQIGQLIGRPSLNARSVLPTLILRHLRFTLNFGGLNAKGHNARQHPLDVILGSVINRPWVWLDLFKVIGQRI